MFFEGSLQDGIAVAVKESKAVLCFVYDDGYPSKFWEETIEEEEVAAVIARHAIALRIVQGSQEAQFMSPFRQASSAPVIMIIKDRKVKASFSHPEASDTLKSRLLAVFGKKATPSAPTTPRSDQDAPSTSPGSARSASSRPLQDWQIQKKAREKRERVEIERIRALIHDDSAERRHRGDVRKPHGETSPSPKLSPSISPIPAGQAPDSKPPAQIRIQIRLLDGSTFRSAFPSEVTLSSHVRPWIKSLNAAAAEDDEEEDTTPYRLKVILAPFPNRTIQPAEEELPLSDLDLGSTCTLIVVPIRNFAESYTTASSSSPGMLGSALSRTYSFITAFFLALIAMLWRIFASIPTGQRQQKETAALSATSTGSARQRGTGEIRVRTLADQRREEEEKTNDREFYNGNQLNFQPRKEEEEGKKES